MYFFLAANLNNNHLLHGLLSTPTQNYNLQPGIHICRTIEQGPTSVNPTK